MSYRFESSTEHVDWERVVELLDYYLHGGLDAATQKLAFERSYARSFVYDGDQLIGVGRALSDGISQAAIYNVALDDRYQGQQLGRGIVRHLISQVPGCTVILYTHPQTVSMYEKFGFRRMKTGMMTLSIPEEEAVQHLNGMEARGFLFPEGQRFHDNYFENLPYGAVVPPEKRSPVPRKYRQSEEKS